MNYIMNYYDQDKIKKVNGYRYDWNQLQAENYDKEVAPFFEKYKRFGNKNFLFNLFRGICEGGLPYFKRNEAYFKSLSGEDLLMLIDFINEGKQYRYHTETIEIGYDALQDRYFYDQGKYLGLGAISNDLSYDVINYIENTLEYEIKIDGVKRKKDELKREREEQQRTKFEKDNEEFMKKYGYDRYDVNQVAKKFEEYNNALTKWIYGGIIRSAKKMPKLVDFGLTEEVLRDMTDYYEDRGLWRSTHFYEQALETYKRSRIKLFTSFPQLSDFDLVIDDDGSYKRR